MTTFVRRASHGRGSWRMRRAAPPSPEHLGPADQPTVKNAFEVSNAFEVVHTRVIIRAAPSVQSAALGSKLQGSIITAEAVKDGWVRLCDNAGWMLIDGTSLGLGLLLRQLPQGRNVSSHRSLAYTADHVLLRSGVHMPLLGLGTGGVPGLEGEEAVKLITHAIKHCGVRLIDTAADYHNEEAVGEAIRRSGVPRHELFICTKFGPHSQSYEAATASVQRSLQRMQLTYLDCVFIHWPGAWVPEQKDWTPQDWLSGRGVQLARERRAASWRALEDLKMKHGVLRHVGVSNYTPEHLEDLMRSCRVPPDILQSEHHPFFSNAAVRAACARHGIAFMAYGPFSGGHTERSAGQKGVHNRVVQDVAASAARTPAQVVLRWATQRGVAVLPKSRRVAGIEENSRAKGFDLTDAQLARLDGLETGEPSYWDPQCVDQLDHFNIFLDKEKLRAALGAT